MFQFARPELNELFAALLLLREAAHPRDAEPYFDLQTCARGLTKFLPFLSLIFAVRVLKEKLFESVKEIKLGRGGADEDDDKELKECLHASNSTEEIGQGVHDALLNLDFEGEVEKVGKQNLVIQKVTIVLNCLIVEVEQCECLGIRQNLKQII